MRAQRMFREQLEKGQSILWPFSQPSPLGFNDFHSLVKLISKILNQRKKKYDTLGKTKVEYQASINYIL